MRRFFRLALPALLLASVVSAFAQTSDDFTVVLLPDTQFYSAVYPQIYQSQMNWIAANRATRKIQFVLGLGDIVDNGSSVTQWQNADAAVRILDRASIPYLMPLGNHDYDNIDPAGRSTTFFNQYFGPQRYAGRSYFKGNYPSGRADNMWAIFNVNGHPYLVIALEFYPRDAALTWASDILQANPTLDAILVTHAYTYSDNSRIAFCDADSPPTYHMTDANNGEQMWTKFASQFPNIRLVLSGHIQTGTGVGRLATIGAGGNLVNQMLSDYQAYAKGGDGWLRILHFYPSQNRIDVTTYSPYLNQYLTDADNAFSVPIRRTATSATTGNLWGRVRASNCTKLGGVTVAAAAGKTSTASDGLYTLALPAGSNYVTSTKLGYKQRGATVTITEGAMTEQDFFLTAQSPGSLSGHVTSSSGTPIPGATVTVDGASTAALTGTTGQYAFSSVLTGAQTLHVTAAGWNAGSVPVTISPSTASTVNVVLTASSACPVPASGVNICSPIAQSTDGSPAQVVAASAISGGIVRSEVWVDGAKKYQVSSALVNTQLSLPAGTHRLVVVGVNAAGSTVRSAIYFTSN